MRKWTIKWHLRAGLLAALLAISSAAQAEPYGSVKALGMGGAATAYGQDAVTAFYNPATATEVCSRWDLEFETRWDNKKLTIGDALTARGSGHFHNEHKWDYYGSGGLNYRFGCNNEWAAGVQWNNYDHIHTHFKDTITYFAGATGEHPRFNYRAEVLTFTGAYSIDACNSIGIGVNVYMSWLSTHGLNAFTALSSDPTLVTDNGRDEANGVGVTIGYLGHFCDDRLNFGVSYSPKVDMGDFKKYRGFLAGHSLDIPATWRVGLAYQLDCVTTFVGDYELRRYSRCRAWNNSYPGDGTTFGAPFGDNAGPGFDWDDQSIVKLGISYNVDPCLTARIGYRWEQTPFAHNAGTKTALDALTLNVVQHYLTTGLTYNWDDCLELSWFAEWGINGTAKARNPQIPNVATTVAPGVISGGANLHYQEQKFATGFAVGQNF